ncbi:hypothetical protein Bbelb_352090 [Branchiostoma belcheri]|nr:hypothetical protein Bbelb_352090 [Branchiostoma belcheri]
MEDDGASYRGTVSVTETGRTCQRWDRQTPHGHTRTSANYPSSGLEQNYCRNPDHEPALWCYTTDPGKRWEFCDVPHCDSTLGDSQKIIFPGPRGIDDYARMETTLSEDLTSFTLCVHMRSNMNSINDMNLVSYAVSQHSNELRLFLNAYKLKGEVLPRSLKVCGEKD